MNYRDMLGFPKKKVKKVVTPSITKKLKEEYGALNEWSKVDTGPKRWTQQFGKGITEFEETGGKDNVNEENESTWTWIYKGLLAGFTKADKKGGVNLESVAQAAAFLIKTKFGASAKNDFIKTFKKWL